MKRLLSSIFLTSCLWVTASAPWQQPGLAFRQAANPDELFYMYFGKRIPLQLRQDAIVVQGKIQPDSSDTSTGGTRGEESPAPSQEPFYLRLQQHLQNRSGGSRGEGSVNANIQLEVKPLGENYALVSLPDSTQTGITKLIGQIQQFSDVSATLPVLTRQNRQETIALPNEIVVSFDRNLSETQIQAILKQQDLELVRRIPFTRNRYVVRSNSATGTAVLNVANQLLQVTGVKSATPNFIQSTSVRVTELPTADNRELTPDSTTRFINNLISQPSSLGEVPTALFPLQWHLYSSPLQCARITDKLGDCLKKSQIKSDFLAPRTDIRAPEAWQQSHGGRGVVVAVIDSIIQWNHPDLQENIYTTGNFPDRCPGEIHGWNFSVMAVNSSNGLTTCPGTPTTRISRQEIGVLAPMLKDTFRLTDEQIVQQYPVEVKEVQPYCKSDCTTKKIAYGVRYLIQNRVTSSFHGTWVSGVIAAHSPTGKGLIGVAPNVKILPVRAAGIGGEFSPESIVASIGYAAARGVDAINLSFGGSTPIQEVAGEISEVLAENPKLVIVAAAGNNGETDSPDVTFPAAMPGVVSVGATNLAGNRTSYSCYGANLDLVAPGGDLDSPEKVGGILTTGGTWLNGFWRGISLPVSTWENTLDPKGGYIWVDGTSFAAPIVSGVFALMKGEDPHRLLSRDRLVAIIKDTASYQGLVVSDGDRTIYDKLRSRSEISDNISAEKYFFGSGLVNAEAAVKQVKESVSSGR